MEREVGGGIGMGNTCKPIADSFQCMTKSTTIKKKEREISKIRKRERFRGGGKKTVDIKNIINRKKKIKFSLLTPFSCYNQNTIYWVTYEQQILFLTFLNPGKFKIREPADSVSDKDLLPRWPSF